MGRLACAWLPLLVAIGCLSVCRKVDSAEPPIEFFQLSEVELTGGPFRHALRLNREHLLQYDPDRLLAPFLEEAGLEPKAPRYPNWESMGLGGHTAGHYLTALANTAAALDDAECRRRLDYMVGELARCQQAGGDGYVGGVSRGRELWRQIASGDSQASGFSLGDRWVPLYNLHKTFAGLRDAYQVAGNQQARGVLVELGRWCHGLFSPLSDAQLQAILATEHGGMNEVLADIAAITGDEAMLHLAERFCHQAILVPLTKQQDRLDGMHANTQIPKVIGFMQIGRMSQNDNLKNAARFFWKTVAQNRSVAIGGNSVSEHFPDSEQYLRFIEHREGPETCNTYNMLRLTEEIFADQADALLFDFYEQALYNHILSTQHPEHGGYVYFTPCRPRHYRVYSQPEVAFWCCVGSGMENHSRYAQAIYAHQGKDLYVNLFAPSRLTWASQGVAVEQQTRFPEEERVRLAIRADAPKRFAINIRRPGWLATDALAITVNGKAVEASKLSSGYASVEREWRDGDVLAVELPMRTGYVSLPNEPEYVAITHGPVVLAAKTSENDLNGLLAGDGRMGHVAAGPLYPLDEAPMLVCEPDDIAGSIVRVRDSELRFSVAEVVKPDAFEGLELIPFYKLHDARYMLYWRRVSPAEHAQQVAALAKAEQRAIELDRRTIDRVAPGQQQPETEHDFQGEQTEAGVADGRSYRSAAGHFSYALRVGEQSPLTLAVSYQESRRRDFAVSWDGVLLTPVKPGPSEQEGVLVREYPIPAALFAKADGGKVRVRFAPVGGRRTPNIVEVRLLRSDSPEAPQAVLPGVNADPHLAFFNGRCYLYPTTDGTEGWRSTSFQAWSSADLKNWRNEGVILDLPRDLRWADLHAWAPAIARKGDRYFYYYSADKNIGVAVADKPEGPFRDPLGKPLVAAADYHGMQCIDPMVFVDDDEQAYLFWGQGRCKAVRLNNDMISFDPSKVRDITPSGYNEGPFVHKRAGRYYLSWSEFDTRDPRYSVCYGTADSPLGPFQKAAVNPILKQRGVIKGAGHHSIGQIPGTYEWVIAYHRFRIPGGDGYHRETCLSPLRHNPDGSIAPVDVFEPAAPRDLGAAPQAEAETATPPPARLSIDLLENAKPISPDLFGVFFEDLNYAADGGLYAELVQNRSFEYSSADQRGWHALSDWELVQREGGQGEVVVESNQPLHSNNPHYAVLGVKNEEGLVGLANAGFDGVVVEQGKRYDVSVFARQLSGKGGNLSVRLEDAKGQPLAEHVLAAPGSGWEQLTTELSPSRSVTDARLVLVAGGVGRVALDMISLFPRDTFKGRKNGLRKDLAEAIADLRPRFVRFPGGCLVHGDGLDNLYRWQDTVGPLHERKSQRNIWKYHQSLGLGYFEYFQFCEDIGAKPLPVVPAGVCCQNAGASVTGKWGQGQRGIPMDEMPAYVQEVLDLIEYANGPADSRWGRVRAEAGHPEPFGLEYLGVGNEDHITPEFAERFEMIHRAMTEKHPEITVIGTVGPAPDGADFENGWRIANRLRLAMVDEHYYRSPEWFRENLDRYDQYSRSEAAIYLGEFAAHDKNRRSTLRSALAEAAYMTQLEQNGDVVRMASYAPLLGKIGRTQWNPNLIYFTNTEVRPTINYQVQRMFGSNCGNALLASDLSADDQQGVGLPYSVVRDSTTNDVIVKLVNSADADTAVTFELNGIVSHRIRATVTLLAGRPDSVNHDNRGEDLLPQVTERDVAPRFTHLAPAHSLSVVRLSD